MVVQEQLEAAASFGSPFRISPASEHRGRDDADRDKGEIEFKKFNLGASGILDSDLECKNYNANGRR